MPTEPFKPLFDPDLSKAGARSQIDAARAVIDELRNYGHGLFARSSVRPSGGDEEMVILLIYYHLLEMLDATGILVAESAPTPARLQLRAMFEALLSLEYLVEGDTVRRAHAYLVCDIAERFETYDQLDPSSAAGKAYRQSLASDPDCGNVPIPKYDSSYVEKLKTVLAQPLYADAWAEFQRLRTSGRRHPHWYEFYGGPRSLKSLAAALGHAGAYEILYGMLSATGHGNDVVRRILTKGDQGGPAAVAIRDPSEISTVVNSAVNYALDATRIILRRYRAGEELKYAEWYVSEVRKPWFAVDGMAAPVLPKKNI